MHRLSALLLAVSTACATTPKAPAVFIPEARRPEARELPPHPRTEELKNNPDEWTEVVMAGDKAQKSGLLISEGRAARDILFRTRYEEMRKIYDADRLVWSAHRAYYEERLNLAADEIQKLQPTWWDRNKDTVGFVSGVLIGFGLTLGIVEAVYAAK